MTQGISFDTYFELGNSWHTPATTQSKNQIEKGRTDAQGIADLAGSTWWRGGGGDFNWGARRYPTMTQGLSFDTYFELGSS